MTSHSRRIDNLEGRSFSASAPAKLNLRLKIIGRRADGYHLLSMLNVGTDLEDGVALRFQASGQSTVSIHGGREDLGLLDARRNLACRAADDLMRRSGGKLSVHVELSKLIPLGAGLGGGSSDAACVLRLVQSAFAEVGVRVDDDALFSAAESLGADVAYFLRGGLARVSGVGECISQAQCPCPRELRALLFLPAQGISTPALYSEYRKQIPDIFPQEDTALVNWDDKQIDPRPWYEQLLTLVDNDFERVLRQFSPSVWSALHLVRRQGTLIAGLTGSGSAFFALPRHLGAEISGVRSELEVELRASGVAVREIALRTSPTY